MRPILWKHFLFPFSEKVSSYQCTEAKFIGFKIHLPGNVKPVPQLHHYLQYRKLIRSFIYDFFLIGMWFFSLLVYLEWQNWFFLFVFFKFQCEFPCYITKTSSMYRTLLLWAVSDWTTHWTYHFIFVRCGWNELKISWREITLASSRA